MTKALIFIGDNPDNILKLVAHANITKKNITQKNISKKKSNLKQKTIEVIKMEYQSDILRIEKQLIDINVNLQKIWFELNYSNNHDTGEF